VALRQVSPRTSVSPANLHSICFSTIIFIITRGWYNRPGVAAVPIASQSRIKKKTGLLLGEIQACRKTRGQFRLVRRSLEGTLKYYKRSDLNDVLPKKKISLPRSFRFEFLPERPFNLADNFKVLSFQFDHAQLSSCSVCTYIWLYSPCGLWCLIYLFIFKFWFVTLLALRPLLAYCASLGW
jgi:hypothetical protein